MPFHQPLTLLRACHKVIYDNHVPLQLVEDSVTSAAFTSYLTALTDGSLHPQYDIRLKERRFRVRAQAIRQALRSAIRMLRTDAYAAGVRALHRADHLYFELLQSDMLPIDQIEVYNTDRLFYDAEALLTGEGLSPGADYSGCAVSPS